MDMGKVNPRNNMTLVIILGGCKNVDSKNTIYYNISDCNNKPRTRNVWLKSQIKLPNLIDSFGAILTRISTGHPVLNVFDGTYGYREGKHYPILLSDIIGKEGVFLIFKAQK